MRCRADAFRAQVLDGALFVMGGWATLNLAEHVMLLSFCDVAPARCCLSHENLRQQFGSEWSWVGGCCAPPNYHNDRRPGIRRLSCENSGNDLYVSMALREKAEDKVTLPGVYGCA